MAKKQELIDKTTEINVYVSRARPRKADDAEAPPETGQGQTLAYRMKLSTGKFLSSIGRAIASHKKQSRPTKPLSSPNDPTPERLAKEPRGFGEDTDGFDKIVVKQGNVYEPPQTLHRVRDPISLYRRHIGEELADVADKFRLDAEAAIAVARLTANYDNVSRATPGPRAGGVTDQQRERYQRFGDLLRTLNDGEKEVLKNLVLGVPIEAIGRPMTAQEVGALFTMFGNDEAKKGSGAAFMISTLWQVHKFYYEKERADSLSSVRPQIKGPRR